MRERLARLTLFILPLTLLLGEQPLIKKGGVSVYWFEVLTVIFALLTWPELRSGGLKRLKALPKLTQWGAALMVPALIISVTVAQVRHEALGAAVAWFLVPMLLTVLIIASGIEVTALVFGIVVAALIQTAYGLQLLPIQQEPRLVGTFTSPNFYAAVVVPAIFLSLLLPMKGKWLPMIVLLWGLILSQSLGGFLGLIGGGLYLIFILVKDTRARLAMAVLVFLIGCTGAFIAKQRFSNNPSSSLVSRQQIWHVAWEVGKEHPLTGVGLKNFDNIYLQKVNTVYAAPLEYNVPEPHDLYLAFWLDLSVVGLVAMLLIIGGAVIQGGIVVAPLVALLVHGLVDTPIFKLELAVLFWLYIALIFTFRNQSKQTP
jgi:O-antigen ligase